MEKIYRFTTNSEGVFSAGKRLLPEELVDEVEVNRKWLSKPRLDKSKNQKYRFYLTEKGKEKYKKTLFISHKKYLPNIKLDIINKTELGKIAYEDEYQVVKVIE